MTNPNSGISQRRKKRDLRPCRQCGYAFDKTLALCPSCKQWDAPVIISSEVSEDETVLLSEVSDKPLERLSKTGPWDKCFSYNQTTKLDGIVTVQVALIGGAPGAGKSTLALQIADAVAAATKREIIYIAAEEAKEQIKDRALRLKVCNIHLIRVYPLGASTDLGEIFQRRKPAAVIVDSLQGLTSELEQSVDYCKAFKEYSVALNAPFIVISQVNKDEDLAGLMSLQHAVDTTMLFTIHEDEEKTRQLESLKNRFGPSQSVYLKMTETGLHETAGFDDDDDEDWKAT